MKKLLPILLLTSTMAYAGDEEFDCHKNHEHAVECKAKRDGVGIKDIQINGDECESVPNSKINHHAIHKGEKFTVPGSKECFYVRGMTILLEDGNSQHFNAM